MTDREAQIALAKGAMNAYNEVAPALPAENVMTYRNLLFPLLACGLLAAPYASAAPRSTAKSAPKSAPRSAAKSAGKQAAPAAPKEDSPLLKHEQYPAFLELLQKQVKENSSNYEAAVICVLRATGGDETAVKEWMQVAARGGNAAAERWMLNQVLSDIPPEKLMAPEIVAAYQKLGKVAASGYVPAALDVSACLRMGIGTAKDEAAAQKQLMAACKDGDFLARFQWLLTTGRLSTFADKDKPEVASEIERGNHHVIYRLSSMAPDAATQLEWIKKAAEKGSGSAYFALSSLASAQHPKESLVLLKEAVSLGNPDALFVMASGLIEENPSNPYVREAGLTPNPEEGKLLLKAAALLGNIQASLALANAYYDGTYGLPKNPELAYFHFNNPQIASTAASAAARGLLMLTGSGVKQDTKQGLELLQRAVQANYPYATILLAYAQYKGLGMPADAKAATELLSEAAAMGAPVAYVYQAFITAKGGPGLEPDVAGAKRYVRLASMDLGDRAQQLYDALMVQGDWVAHP